VPARRKPLIDTLSGVSSLSEYLELVDSWMIHLEARNRSAATRELYRHTALDLAAFLLEQGLPTTIEDLTRAHLQAYLIEQLRLHPNTSTPVTKHNVLAAWMHWLRDEEIIARSPMEGVPQPDKQERPITVIADKVVQQLLASCDSSSFEDRRDLAILRIFVDTPLRRTEVANLLPADIDLGERVVSVRVKGNRIRVVPIGAKTTQAIDRYRRVRAKHRHASDPYFWIGRKGRLTPEGVYMALRRRAERLDIEGFHPHLFRHLFAHGWLEAGGQEADLMRLGGWRSTEIMRHYAESLAERRAVESYRRLSPGDRF
jgi:site-specific recombinase XerD